MSTLTARLRPYQRDAIEAIDEAVAHGHRSLIVAPTGSGKTWTLAESVSLSLRRGEGVLVLVHQEELLENLVKQIQVAEPEVGLSIEQATRYADLESKVVVGSIPTLAHPKAQRRLDRLGRFDRVYVDMQPRPRTFGCSARSAPTNPAARRSSVSPRRRTGATAAASVRHFTTVAYEISLPFLIETGVLVARTASRRTSHSITCARAATTSMRRKDAGSRARTGPELPGRVRGVRRWLSGAGTGEAPPHQLMAHIMVG